MNVFKLRPEDDDCIELSVYKYNKATKQESPWQVATSNGKRHYAVCPECDNPTQVINLDSDDRGDESGAAMPLHARHAGRDIPGIGKHNEDAYLSCPLAHPETFAGGPTSKGKPSRRTDEILRLLMEETSTVKYFMEKLMGISINETMLRSMLKRFADMEGHLYRSIGKLNLPYAVLYMAKHQVAANKVPFTQIKDPKSPFVEALRRSTFFRAVEKFGQKYIERIPSAPSDAQLSFHFPLHRIPKANGTVAPQQYLILRILERGGGKENELFEVERAFDLHHFYNAVARNRRERAIASNILSALRGYD